MAKARSLRAQSYLHYLKESIIHLLLREPCLWIICLAGYGSTEKIAMLIKNSDNIMTLRYIISKFT